MSYKPVDTAIIMTVGPCIDDTDFKSLEEAIAYDAIGMDVSLIVEKTDGTTAVTAITLTTAGTSDWTHKDGGYYEIEVTAAQNIEEGIAYIRGVCTGVLPFESVHYNIVKANVYDSWIKGTDVLQTDVTQWLGTGVHANVAGYPSIDLISMGGATQSLIDLKDFADSCYDPVNNIIPVNITQLLGIAIATPSIAGVLEVDLTHMGGVAQSAADLKLFADDCYSPVTGLVNSNLTRIQGTSQSAADLKDFVDNCYIPGTNSISLVNTCTANTDVTALAAICTETRLAELDAANLPTTTDDILTGTAVIGAAGAGLTNLGGMSTGMKAEVESEANDALIAVHLDHLLAVDYDPAVKPGTATALLNELIENDGGVSRYTANALEQAPSGGTNPNVLADTTLTLTDQTHFVLAAGSNDDDAYLDQAIVLYDASDSDFPSVRKVANYAGATRTITLDSAPDFTMTTGDGVKIFVTAPGTSAPTVGQIRVEMEGAGYKLALIEADTDELQTNQGNWATAVVTALSAQGKLDVNAECDTALGDMFTSSVQLVDDIWDELLTAAAHNVATSAGRRMRELGAYHITSGTAQAGAAHSITLAATETAGDHILNRNLIVILAGTGVGQTRTIVDYASSSKIAVVDRDWITNPDDTSEYTIIPDDTPLVANHGVATAGTSTTITIAATASAIDSTYANSIIQIMAGTGAGQSQLIDSYNGTTKVVTVCDTWTTTPDNTSVYVILPYGVANVCNIGTDALALIKAECDTALTDYDSPTRAEATTDKNAIIAEVDANEIKIDALNDITVADIIAGIADGTYDFQEMMRLIFAESCGKASGGGTSTIVFRNPTDTKDRIIATVDADGNRTPTTRDGS